MYVLVTYVCSYILLFYVSGLVVTTPSQSSLVYITTALATSTTTSVSDVCITITTTTVTTTTAVASTIQPSSHTGKCTVITIHN